MANGMDAARAHALADQLTQGYYTHDYPISASALQAIGVKVRTDMPAEIYQLMALYPQPGSAHQGWTMCPCRTIRRRRRSPSVRPPHDAEMRR